jgi:hypothetical protein
VNRNITGIVNEEKKKEARVHTEDAEVGAPRTQRRKARGTQEHRQECLYHTLRCDTIQGSVVERNLS